jgi:hypothetical protein
MNPNGIQSFSPGLSAAGGLSWVNSRHNKHNPKRVEAQRAMAVGVSKRLWKFVELFSKVPARYL